MYAARLLLAAVWSLLAACGNPTGPLLSPAAVDTSAVAAIEFPHMEPGRLGNP